MKGADIVAKALKAEGVEFITGFPLNPIFDSAAALDIRPIITRTERVAVNIADGYARATGGKKVGVCAVQYGPGAENAFGGFAEAFADSSPVLCMAGAYPRRSLAVRPNFKASRAYAPIAKWAETVDDAAWIPQMMQNAFTLMRSGRPGPVLLEFPRDVTAQEVPDGAVADYVPSRAQKPTVADVDDVRETLEALLAAENPVIVAGQGILYSGASDLLRAFAELVRVPVMSTLNGKGAFPEHHPLALGVTNGLSRSPLVNAWYAKADLILGIGTSFTRSIFLTPIPAGKKMGQITLEETDIGKDYPVSFGAIGDAKAVLGQLIDLAKGKLGPRGRTDDDSEIKAIDEAKTAYLRKWMPRLTSSDEPISPYRVVWELMRTLDPKRSVITHDAGNPRDQIVPFYETQVPHGYIGWGKSTPLGSGLGLIMGAKLARPDWMAVNLMGDASFGMVGMDFETAVRCNIPILTIVMNNGVMGDYTTKQPIASKRYALNVLTGNYAAVAEALGGRGIRLSKVAELSATLKDAIASVEAGTPTLLEIMTREEPVFPGV